MKRNKILGIVLSMLMILVVGFGGVSFSADLVEPDDSNMVLDIGDETTYEFNLTESEATDSNGSVNNVTIYLQKGETSESFSNRTDLLSQSATVSTVNDSDEPVDYRAEVTFDNNNLIDATDSNGDNVVDEGTSLVVHAHNTDNDTHIDETELTLEDIVLDEAGSSESSVEEQLVSPMENLIGFSLGLFGEETDVATVDSTFTPADDSNVHVTEDEVVQSLDSESEDAFEEVSSDYEDGDAIEATATVDGEPKRVFLNEAPDDVEGAKVVYDEDNSQVVVKDAGDSEFDFEVNTHEEYSAFEEWRLFEDISITDILTPEM